MSRLSPAQRHLARAAAVAIGAATIAAREGRPMPEGLAGEYLLRKAQLGVDLRRLKEIHSIEKKIALKRELIPEYVDWVKGVLEADSGAEDLVFIHVLIWSIDVGAAHAAMPLIRYVLKHALPLPERFDRTAPTYIAEEIAEGALKRLGQEPAPEADDLASMIRLLDEIDTLVADEDIYDQVRAKLEKAQGLAIGIAAERIEPGADGPAGARRARIEEALAHLRAALRLNSNAGVKKRIDQLARLARAEPESDAPADAPAD